MRTLLLLLAALVCCTHGAVSVWPKPQSIISGQETFSTVPSSFSFVAVGHQSELLQDAFVRYARIIFLDVSPTQEQDAAFNNFTVIAGADVNVVTDNEALNQETDESYSLMVEAPRVRIDANSVFGAIRALETLSQLFINGLLLPQVQIHDAPRFPIRASMMDTSRHWYPVKTILQHLDAMAYNKMNVFHWHLVDSQSFPLEISSLPLLSLTGAYSPSHVYTRDDIARVVHYATQRGIRVIPEIDTPGHVEMGWNAYKGILTECYDDKGKLTGSTGPLDPTKNATYDFVKTLFTEVKTLFPDAFVHLGGDEVPFDCWQSNPDITAFMRAHPEIKDYAELESYYVTRLLESLTGLNATEFIFWQEIFDNGVKLTPNSIIDVWKGDTWAKELPKVLKANQKALLSAPFYLNYISYGADWVKYYNVEPLADCKGCNATLLMGLEMCMWSEFVDATNFLPRMWPRGSAVAERAWSDATVTDNHDAAIRLHDMRCRLVARGIPAEPVTYMNLGVPRFCVREWDQDQWSRMSGI